MVTQKTCATRGFLPDFSRYLHKDFPIADAYRNRILIEKLQRLVSELLVTSNPAIELRERGCCKKLELMSSKVDKNFMTKCDFLDGNVYYAAYGNTPYRIIFGIDTNQHIAYFFALDPKHSVRKG